MNTAGFCECGCGGRTAIARCTSTDKGWIKNQPIRFINGHSVRGRHCDPVTRAKISAALTGLKKTEAHRAALAAALRGRPLPASTVHAMKMAAAAKSYEQRLRESGPGRQAANPWKHRGEHNRRWWAERDPAQRAQIVKTRADKLRQWWADLPADELRRRHEHLRQVGMVGTVAARLAKPTSIERTVASMLSASGVKFDAEHRIGRYVVDFYVPAKGLVIECDGTYWHSKPDVKARDAIRDEWFARHGYRVVRLTEAEIRSGLSLARLSAEGYLPCL